MIGPKGQRLHKSKVKVSAAQHEAAMKKGAREVKPGAVLYKQGGKLYMMEDSANEKASHALPEQFRRRLLRLLRLPIETNLTGASGTGNRPLAFVCSIGPARGYSPSLSAARSNPLEGALDQHCHVGSR